VSGLDHEKEFEAYRGARKGLRDELPETDGLEPPSELDRIVLAQAREAIRMPASPRHYPMRWALSGALAATFMLVFAITLHFGLLPFGDRSAHEESPTPAMAASAPTMPAAPAAESRIANDAAHAEIRQEALASKAEAPEPPEAWLRRIDELRAQGRSTEADRELRAFRAAWPAHPAAATPRNQP
jgi:hypothetical protein